ncbi:Cenp-O kinetochore centromere component-domain-containing protein [Radiomyces spectabilis]|uniref:Cenp-O kinetochore centromere component-domain-containing protein n=1 Tax=Radiomyces spectabilis TaxID=64574 RepID=UPI00222035A9|nr:Cenp-O kinetochore centromere component-domain-containing protein [Radiomyces spectabilis]KAI8372727.1 Cenp-O kinetochore centromere component-domain-containing protein [Radiomyces spectabilis]
MEDEPFLPTPKDRLKADITDLRLRLNRALEEQRQLKCSLMEEKIAHVITAKFSEEIKDATRHKASQMKTVQQEILQQLMTATEARCVQEMIGYYRLSGRTTFTFQENYTGVRLETFYGRTYRERYYLLLRSKSDSEPMVIEKHTIPHFIPLDRMAKLFLPHDLDTLLRILHDFLLAYVSRREQIEELKRFTYNRPEIQHIASHHIAKNNVEILHRDLRIQLRYTNLASNYPTQVLITPLTPTSSSHDIDHIRSLFSFQKLLTAYQEAFVS